MEVINSFLKKNKTILLLENFSKIVYVMGNTGSDMDSVLSSILLSFALNISNGILEPTSDNEIKVLTNSVIYFPLFNTKEQNFPNLLEINYLFKLYGIDYKSCFYLDDLEVKENLLKDSSSLILVDHNQLDPSHSIYIDKIISIYDHHEESYTRYPLLQQKTIVYPLGSCSTIILMKHYICDEKVMKIFLDKDLTLFGAAIWLDTREFDITIKCIRWIEMDLFVFNYLSSYGKLNKEVYYKLKNVKYDINENLNLGLDSLMNKDLKIFEYNLNNSFILLSDNQNLEDFDKMNKILVKYSSFQVDFKLVVDHFGYADILKYFSAQDCEIVVTLSEHKNCRLVSLYFNYKHPIFNSKMSEKLINQIKERLGSFIIEWMDTNIPNYYNILMSIDKVSRKILEPILRKIFEL